MLPASAAAVMGGCEVAVEVDGLFEPANRPEDGAGADAFENSLVTVALDPSPAALAPLSCDLARLANKPPAGAVVAGVATFVLAVEAPKLLNKLGVAVPVVVVDGVDDGCVVIAGVEDGKLNMGLDVVEDEVPLPSALNRDGAVP